MFKENQTVAKFQESIEIANTEWDMKLKKLKENLVDVENEMIEKQKAELTELKNSLDQNIPENPKLSVALLNIKNIQQNLKKQKK